MGSGARRIVLVMIEPPLPFGNAASRWFYVLLKGLVERGHRVTAFAACSKPTEVEEARDLFPQPKFDLRCYPFPAAGGLRRKWQTLTRPYSYMFSEEMRRDLEATLAEGFDVLHLEQLWSGWLGLRWKSRTVVNVHYLYSIDLAGRPARGIGGRIERGLMWYGERRLLRSYLNYVTLTSRLSEAVQEKNSAARAVTVPLALDLSLYPYVHDQDRAESPVVSVIGSMDWWPSRSAATRFLTRLWPEIRRQVPQARAQIVGWNARKALREYLCVPGVTIIENVPDIRPYFAGTSVLVYAPVEGSGMKIKVLEAMAFGVPVVTTSRGVEGLPAEDGVHGGVSEDDSGLIERTVSLLGNRARQNSLRAAGRALLEGYCNPARCINRLEDAYAMFFGARGGESVGE